MTPIKAWRPARVDELDVDEEMPTAKTCSDCKGSGTYIKESGTRYTASTCRFCNGHGRIPISGVIPAVKRDGRD